MNSGKLLLALAIGLIIGLIIYWINPSGLQNDIGEPNVWWILGIVVVIALIAYWFLASFSYDMY